MNFYISQIVQGIASGLIYGVIGLSLMFIYRSTRVVNFAQGEMATAVVYFTSSMMHVFPKWISIALGLVFAFLLGVFFEVSVLKLLPNRRTGISAVIATIAFSTILNSIIGWKFGYEPLPFPALVPDTNVNIGSIIISHTSILLFISTALISLVLFILFRYTTIGIAFEAISEDPMAAQLKGVRVEPLLTISWGLSSLLGGIAGLLIAPITSLHPNMTEAPLLFAFAAAVIGGLQSSFGSLVGGVIIGVTESLAGSTETFGSNLKLIPIFGIMVLFLMFRPTGLFGKDEPRKI